MTSTPGRRQPRDRSSARFGSSLWLVATLAAGCARVAVPPAAPIASPAAPDPVAAELGALRASEPANTTPAVLSRRAFLEWFSSGDLPLAWGLADEAARHPAAGPSEHLRRLELALMADRPGEAVQDAAWILDHAPTSLEAETALARVTSRASSTEAYDRLLGPALARVLERPEGNPQLYFDATGEHRGIQTRAGDASALSRSYRQRGTVQAWTVTRGWGRDPFSEYSRDFPPTLDPDGPFGDPLHPATPHSTGRAVIEVETPQDGTAFARAYVRVDRPVTFFVVFSAGGTAALQVDGVPAVEVTGWTRFTTGTEVARVSVAAGWHRLLVRLPCESERPWFFLYLMGAGGPPPPMTLALRLPEGARVSPDRPEVREGAPPGTALHGWRERAATSDPEALYFLARIALGEGDPFHGRDAADTLERRWPDAPGTWAAAADVWRADPSNPTPVREDRVARLLRRLVEGAPGAPRAACDLATAIRSTGDEEASLALLDAGIDRHPGAGCLRLLRLQALLALQSWTAARTDLEALEAAWPGSAAAAAARLDFSRLVDASQVRPLQERALIASGMPPEDRTADLLLSLGRAQEALEVRWQALALEPMSRRALTRLHDALVEAGRAEEAGQIREQVRVLFPWLAWPVAAMARAELERGDRAAAHAAARAAVALDPDDEDLHKLVVLTGGEPDRWAPPWDPVAEVARFEAAPPAGSETVQRVVVRSTRTVRFQAGGSLVQRVAELVRVQTPGAVEAETRGASGVGRILRRMTVKPDGRVVEPEVVGPQGHTLRDLSVNDYVFDARLSEEVRPRPAGGSLGLGPLFPLDGASWTDRADCEVLFEPGVTEQFAAPGDPSWQRSVEADGTVAWRRAWRGVPPDPVEPGAPARVERGGWFFAGTGQVPEDRMAPARRDWTVATVASPAVQRLAAQLLVPGEPAETVRAMSRWVAENTDSDGAGNGRTGASHTLSERRGSAAHLLGALLRAAGLAVEPWLIRPLPQSNDHADLPLPGWYGRRVLRVPAAGEAGWLAPEDRSPPGWLAPGMRGAPGWNLAAPPGSDPRVQVPEAPQAPPRLRLVFDVAVGPDGAVTGQVRLESLQAGEEPLRERFWNTDAARRQQVLERWWTPLLPGLRVSDVARVAPTGRQEALRLSARVEAAGVLFPSPAGGLAATGLFPGLPAPLSAAFPDFAALLVGQSRRFPLWLRGGELDLEVRLRGLPRGASSAWAPIRLRTELVDLDQAARTEGDQTILQRRLVVRTGVLGTDAFADFRARMLQALSQAAAPVHFGGRPAAQ